MSFNRWRSLVDGTEIDVSAIPDSVVEDFERENPLDDYGGDVGDFSITQTNPFEGDNALFVQDNDGVSIASTTGLDTYPQRGDVFSCRLRVENTTPNAYIMWATQEEVGASSSTGYAMAIALTNDTFRLTRFDDGSRTIIDTTDVSDGIPKDEYLTCRVTNWDDSGNIAAELMQGEEIGQEQEGTELATVSATDTNYTSGGIGFFFDANFGSDGAGRHDYYIIEERP